MKHYPSRKKTLALLIAKTEADPMLQFKDIGFDHITTKMICTNCNANLHAKPNLNCCSNPTPCNIGKIMRTPKGNKRYKWKKFYAFIARRSSTFLTRHPHLIKKYNLDPSQQWLP